MQLLEGRKAAVTGGSRGIGREICLLLAENGADVALAYRKSTVEAEQLREEIAAMGRSCIAVQADVSVSADVDRFVTQAAQALGMNLIDAGHFATENPVVAVLAEKIAAAFPGIQVKISETHRDCMKFY